MSKLIDAIEKEQITKEIPTFSPGDTVIVQVRVKEGSRERLQAFEGIVIAKRNRGLNSSFTVRKISHGESMPLPGSVCCLHGVGRARSAASRRIK